MPIRQKIFFFTIAVMLLTVILELVRRRRLAEEYSVLWILAALLLLGASIRRDLIDRSAAWLGIYYGPAVLLLGLVVAVSAVLLWMSVILSRQQAQIDHLIEESAILAAELRDDRRVAGAATRGAADLSAGALAKAEAARYVGAGPNRRRA